MKDGDDNRRFWLSWYQAGAFTLHTPWWVSGSGARHSSRESRMEIRRGTTRPLGTVLRALFSRAVDGVVPARRRRGGDELEGV